MTTYDIGMPGSPYQELGDIVWNDLEPGDIVNVHGRSESYNERLLLDVQGTEDQPITIQGVPGPNGEIPVLDSDGATTDVQFSNFNLEYRQELGGSIYIGPANSYPSPEDVPQFIIISGFEITGAGQGNSFTDTAGVEHSYGGSAGVYIKGGDDITIQDNFIHHNGMGVFSNSNHEYEITENLVIDGNTFEDNGLSGSYLRHHVYSEGVNTTVNGNTFGDKIDGDQGSLLKMRDVGVTITNNDFGSSPGHIIDLGDVQSDAMVAAGLNVTDEFHNDNVISGNTIDATTGNIYLGGDSLGKEGPIHSETYRKSVDFTDNTITFETDRSDVWRLGVLRAPSSDQTFNFSGNEIVFDSETDGELPSNFSLLADRGNLNVTGPNTVAGPVELWADNSSQDGEITGIELIDFDGVIADPDPVDPDPDPVDPDPDPVDPDPVDPVDPTILGSDGEDSLFGKNEDDTMRGFAGDDTIYGSQGNDVIFGNQGADFLSGDGGNDSLFGGLGDDYLDGSYGNDLVAGGDGDDRVSGGHGDDVLLGGSGKDKLLGGNNDDILFGGAGDDHLEGGSGNDVVIGGAGENQLFGGEGADTFVFNFETAFDAKDGIWDFNQSQGDRVNLTDLLQNFNSSTDNIEDFVSLAQSGWKHAVLSVDVDGGGDNFQEVVTIGYGKGLNISDILDYSDLSNELAHEQALADLATNFQDDFII
ncbi:type I secretion C-terminal target domain-containing protein [Lentilitoribacter sp. Alg239-R112]|uniref:type I secretion C-terminal target domain-containing protein n=1 Tax=Lentilitoribacter sp. Alg239-R112 TaxID=2305987 RepID=UPI0013A6B089|nr:type I secretion C-terminal target domain-containing protein [Lentilitoribacter sp. Alg239-R112]